MAKRTSNEQELQELQGEGGSDVFTTTRHINYNQHQPVKTVKIVKCNLVYVFLNILVRIRIESPMKHILIYLHCISGR